MNTWNNDWTGFFVIYFKWCYYLCVSPFYFQWDTHTNRFKIMKSSLQSCVCAMQYFLIGTWYLKDLRKIPVDSLQKNPYVYFSLAFNLNSIYYHIGVFAISYWRRQERFLAIVNFDCKGNAGSSVKYKSLSIFLCSLFALLPLVYSVCGYSIVSSSRIWNPSLMFRCLVVEGRFAFFVNGTTAKLASDSCSNNVLPDIYDITILDCILGVLAFLMETSRQVIGFYTDFFPLICCLSIWACVESLSELMTHKTTDQTDIVSNPTPDRQAFHHQYYRPRFSFVDELRVGEANKNFSNENHTTGGGGGIMLSYITKNSATMTSNVAAEVDTSAPIVQEIASTAMQEKQTEAGIIIENCCEERWRNTVLERYGVCKSFARIVNRALGQVLFTYILSSIMYLSTCMDAVLVLQDWFGKLRVAFFFLIFMLMFFIGSEIVNKVYGFRDWLSDSTNNIFIPEKNLLVLIHEVNRKSIGVNGNGMFTVTYSTFMTVMTTTVTFFIIILQFQKPTRGNSEDLSAAVTTLNSTIRDLTILFNDLNQVSSLQIPRENLTQVLGK